MHTLNEHPAYYQPGSQICYAGGRVKRLANSLRQIRREQELSDDYRNKQGMMATHDYGYAIVYVETPKAPRSK